MAAPGSVSSPRKQSFCLFICFAFLFPQSKYLGCDSVLFISLHVPQPRASLSIKTSKTLNSTGVPSEQGGLWLHADTELPWELVALSITCCSVHRAALGAAQQEGGGETKIGDVAGRSV